MNDTFSKTMFSAAMSEKDFTRASGFIQNRLGIMMPRTKKTMLESRLNKRLRALGIDSFSEYFDYVFSPSGTEKELVHMIDLVTTNKTDFFRESNHFDYLVNTALPELGQLYSYGPQRKLLVWSAGCSTGEEPYTIAMVLQDHGDRHRASGPEFQILATDISTKVLEMARNGIYTEEKIAPVPMEMRRKYLLRSRDKNRGLIRIHRNIRDTIMFRRLNFMEEDFGFQEQLDIIFCRNVVIYFDRRTQEHLFKRFYQKMVPGGFMFIGHSETLNGLNVPFVRVDTSVYRKPL